MHDRPWIGGKGSVLEWLSEQTGLPVSISRAKPEGVLTLVNAQANGAAKKYTLAEVMDILNDELSKQKMVLVRRARTFTIEPIDEKIDPAALPRVMPGELERYGNTELVSCVFSLSALLAEDFAKEVKGMLGPQGAVVPLANANKLVVQDTVANLKRIQAIVKDNNQDAQKIPGFFSHSCQYIPARHAARVVSDLLGDPKELVQAWQAQLAVREGLERQFNGQFGESNVPKVRMHYVSVDERQNTVLVTGSADKIAQAEAILKKIDVPQHKDQKPIEAGSAVLKAYPVPGGNAELLARGLQEIYKNVSEIRIAAVTHYSIMVWAGPSDQAQIFANIRASREQNNVFEVIPLTSLDAADAVDTLKGMLAADTKTGAPYLKADTKQNAVVAKGTSSQLADIKNALKALGEGSASPSASSRVVLTIEQGNTVGLAEALERMLPQFLQNPVQIQTFGDHDSKRPERPKVEK
jgi:type II secretory pathway component GspD/PulD (secretin)